MGQAAGKLGEMVFYRNAGQQQVRAYVTNPKNPKTYKQAQQRSKFASVSLAYQYLKNIVDRSTRYKDGRTAYNEFLKNNIAAAPYASKSERQEWAGLYTFPAQWVAAFGALARPEIWNPSYTAGGVSSPTTISFTTTYNFLNQILNYALSAGWIDPNPSGEPSFTPTAEQLAEAMAGAPNCHVILATSNASKVGTYNDAVAANGVRVLELTADQLTAVIASISWAYEPGEGWQITLIDSISISGAGGSLNIAAGDNVTSDISKQVNLVLGVGVPVGHLYSAWIGSNSGTVVQVSNVIFEVGGTELNATATARRDVAQAETAAAIASWQTAEEAGTDQQIY